MKINPIKYIEKQNPIKLMKSESVKSVSIFLLKLSEELILKPSFYNLFLL